MKQLLLLSGESGIRTRGTLLEYTHFPGVLLKPLGHVSPDTLDGFLSHFGIDRTIDWEFTDRRVEWFKDHKVNVRPIEDKHYEEWFRKRKYPAKVTLEELKDELDELAYGDKQYDFTEREHKKITTLRTVIDAAQGSKAAKKYIDKWS